MRKHDMQVKAYNSALAKRQDDPDLHHSIARWLYSNERYDWALKNLHRALELDPEHLGATMTLAWLLASCPDSTLRDGPKAVILATKGYALGVGKGAEETEWMIRNHLTLLAAAHAETGEWNKAVAFQMRAIQATSTRTHIPQLQADLDRYAQAQAAQILKHVTRGSANDA